MLRTLISFRARQGFEPLTLFVLGKEHKRSWNEAKILFKIQKLRAPKCCLDPEPGNEDLSQDYEGEDNDDDEYNQDYDENEYDDVDEVKDGKMTNIKALMEYIFKNLF